LTKDMPASYAAGFAGNPLPGGVVGMGVDAVTGAATDQIRDRDAAAAGAFTAAITEETRGRQQPPNRNVTAALHCRLSCKLGCVQAAG
jgi:hypothetical protein